MINRRQPMERRTRAERRESPRVATTANIRFLRAGSTADEVLPAELLDVSHTGVSISLDRPLIRGECILVEVRDGEKNCFNLSAQVVWVESNPDDQHHVGCELRVELTRKQFVLLRELVAVPGR